MRQRCSDTNHRSYKDYGGRGIGVCDSWGRFENFLADMGERPMPGFSINRINNDMGYYPDNCEWASSITQAHNRRPRTQK